MTTVGDTIASKAAADDRTPSSKVAPKVGAMVMAEAKSPSLAHEAMSAYATALFGPIISMSSPQH
jgi:hypothetical protein